MVSTNFQIYGVQDYCWWLDIAHYSIIVVWFQIGYAKISVRCLVDVLRISYTIPIFFNSIFSFFRSLFIFNSCWYVSLLSRSLWISPKIVLPYGWWLSLLIIQTIMGKWKLILNINFFLLRALDELWYISLYKYYHESSNSKVFHWSLMCLSILWANHPTMGRWYFYYIHCLKHNRAIPW